LKAELRIKSKGITSTQQFIQRLDDIAERFHSTWEQAFLPQPRFASTSDFFCWNEEGVEGAGIPMAYSGILSTRDPAKPQLGFVMDRMVQRLDGISWFSKDRNFYQVQPVREVILESHTENDM
jgi:hypothetical protein